MELIIKIFGEGKDLNTLQMSFKGIVVFLIAFVLIRVSGRRSFGIHTPLDNIISILLGAILSRAIVGASNFIPVIVSCLIIVTLHRGLCWLIVRYKAVGRFIEGDRIVLFQDGKFFKQNLNKALVSEEDIMQGVRKSALTEDMNKLEKVYMERNGEISTINK